MESCNLELTKTQKLIAKCIAFGMTNGEIGSVIHRSAETVKDQIKVLIEKCGVRNRTALAAFLMAKQELALTAEEIQRHSFKSFVVMLVTLTYGAEITATKELEQAQNAHRTNQYQAQTRLNRREVEYV